MKKLTQPEVDIIVDKLTDPDKLKNTFTVRITEVAAHTILRYEIKNAHSITSSLGGFLVCTDTESRQINGSAVVIIESDDFKTLDA
jgi:hypothetical protein